MNKTGARLSAALLGYIILVILLLTLNPFYLAMPTQIRFTFSSSASNLIGNIFLFLPLGFFYRLATRQRGALLLGAAISIGIEVIQLFIPARTPSVIDILANTMGAWLGAVLHDIIAARFSISKGMVGGLRLETPLMGLVYLLMSLLWVDSLIIGFDPDRRYLSLFIGIIGAIVLSELFRHWWEKISLKVVIYASLAAGIWYFIGISPTFRRSRLMLAIGIAIVLLTALLTALPKKPGERRFEKITLKKVFPFFSLYLLLLALWDPFRPLTKWHWIIGFTNRLSETSMQILIPRVEYLIAFSILGYLLAEWRGRAEIPLRQDLPRLFLIAAGVAVILEWLVGFQIGPGASLIRTVMGISSALFGGMIYHLLRAHIRYLLNR